jgi:hypothetical protein
VLSTIAMAGLPILVMMLFLGGAAKIGADTGDGTPGGLKRLGPAALVPERFSKVTMTLCALGEFGLAVALPTVDRPFVRWLPVVFFAVATYILVDLRRSRPDVGCGCFGEVSTTPVGVRSIARVVVLTAMAVIVALEGVTGADVVATWSWALGAWIGGGVVLLLALSPELEEVVARLRYRAPCELRPLPPQRALSRLRDSAAWRAHAPMLESDEPVDMWRELCWRFFVFPAQDGSDVVFAVYLSGRRPAVRVAVVAPDGRPVTSLRKSIPVSAGS